MPLRLAIGLLSGAALAFQLLLMRLFSITQWHHFAYMVISLALLGYGASGAFLTVVRRPLLRRFETAFVALAALFGLLAAGCFSLAQALRLNPLEMMWAPRQLAVLAAVYLLLALPFFCAGSAVGLALARFESAVHRIYRADLVGAAAGAMAAIGGLYLWLPSAGLRIASSAAGVAAVLVWATSRRSDPLGKASVPAGVLALAAVVLPPLWPAGWLEPRMSEYKAMAKALEIPEAHVVAERSSPLGLLAAVASPRVPFRVAPGLSFHFSGEIPEQILIFRDGEVAAVVDGADPDRAPLLTPATYLRHLPAALPFELAERLRRSSAGSGADTPSAESGAGPSVAAPGVDMGSGPAVAAPGADVGSGSAVAQPGVDIGSGPAVAAPGVDVGSRSTVAVLGAGSGSGLALALAYGAAEIHAVEVDPRLLELWTDELAEFAGRPYDAPSVTRHLAEPRGFLRAATGPFDLIVLPAAGNAASGTTPSLRESYSHTVEALALALERSSEHGLVTVEGETTAPPRTSLKLVATAVEALERAGLEPERHLAVIRSWNRFVLVVKRSPFEAADVEAIRAFCADRAFDVAFYFGMPESEANRFHLLDQPELFRGVEALAGPSRSPFIRDYKFDIQPATDDRPYPLHFFRWSSLGELLRLRTSGGAALLEWDYVFLVVTLAQATLAGLVLIVVPLWWLRRRSPTRGAGRVGLYFLCLGLAFLFLEIAFIQRLTLFLAHPLLAAGVVLAGFLLFAGLGSGVSLRLERLRPQATIRLVAAAIAVVALLELALLPTLFSLGSAWPVALRLPAAFLAIAPLAFLLGMPFPIGLRRVAASHEDLVPWAWGVNGWASVLSAVLATLLAVHFGFTAVVLIACALYLVAALAAPRR